MKATFLCTQKHFNFLIYKCIHYGKQIEKNSWLFFIVFINTSQEMDKFWKSWFYNKIVSFNAHLVGIDFEHCDSIWFSSCLLFGIKSSRKELNV